MKRFSPSDLRYLQGKARDAVELLFVELRDIADVAKTLFNTAGNVWLLVHRARRVLAAVGIQLPDRRFALPIGRQHADVL